MLHETFGDSALAASPRVQTANTRVFMDAHEIRAAYAATLAFWYRQRGPKDDGSAIWGSPCSLITPTLMLE